MSLVFGVMEIPADLILFGKARLVAASSMAAIERFMRAECVAATTGVGSVTGM